MFLSAPQRHASSARHTPAPGTPAMRARALALARIHTVTQQHTPTTPLLDEHKTASPPPTNGQKGLPTAVPDGSTATSAATPANALPSTIHDMMMPLSLSAVSATWKRAQRAGSKPNSPNL
jgi:hypothetical protein